MANASVVGVRCPDRGSIPRPLGGCWAVIVDVPVNLQRGVPAMTENDHPKGALLFILIYLLILAALWTNAYLRLWGG